MKDLISKGMFMETFYLFYWFEKAVLLWDFELILQTTRITSSAETITLYLCIAECFICFILILIIALYVYPKLKRDVLYSLSFILLVPFHIFRESESFLVFLKKKIKFNWIN